VKRRVWFHRAGAVAWTLLLIPALLWWSEAIWFLIIASLYANIKSDWGAAEAADDTAVMGELRELHRKMDLILLDRGGNGG
jgi:hypothetical protein